MNIHFLFHFPSVYKCNQLEIFHQNSSMITQGSGAGTGGAGGATAPPPIFGRLVNPIPTRSGQIMPTIATAPPPPKVFHLPAPLTRMKHSVNC